MELGREVERVAGQFKAFHPVLVGRREDEASILKRLDVFRVHFEPVPVALDNALLPVQGPGLRPFPDIRDIVAKAHRPAELGKSFLLGEDGDHMGAFAELFARGVRNTALNEKIKWVLDDNSKI